METEFIALIKANEGIIYKVTKIYTNNREQQKDLYQEIVYQIWKSYPNFKGKSKVSTWMYRIALNTSIAQINSAKKQPQRVEIDNELLNLVDEKDSLLEERSKLLYTYIKELNDLDKAVILLFLEGKNYDDIAAITGITVTNVGTRLSRIKQKLKAKVN